MRDVSVRPIAWTGAAIALVIAAVVASVLALLHWRGMPFGGDRLPAGDAAPLAAPGLAAAPQEELARDRREKQQRLASAGWVDRAGGVAHIPIADAMELLVQQRSAGAKP